MGTAVAVTCLFAKTSMDYDHSASFAKYHTYSWAGVNVQEPLWQDRIENAVDGQFSAKGWQKVPSGGDAEVSAVGATRNQQTVDTFYDGGFGGGWFQRGWWGMGGPGMATTTVENTPVGTLHVDIFDGQSKKVIWHGTSSDTLSDKPDKNKDKLTKAVADMFKNFPPHEKGGAYTSRMTPPEVLPPPAEQRRPHRGNNLRGIIALLGDAGDEWVDDNVPRLSASLAFYTVLSLIPFLIVVSAIAAHIYGEQAAQGQLMWEIEGLIGQTGAKAIQDLIRSAHQSTTAATVIGLLTLAFSASAVVLELRESLNTIWDIRSTSGFSSWASFLCLVRERFYLFGLIFGVGIVLVASLAVSAFLVAARPLIEISAGALHSLEFGLSFAVVTVLFAAVYKLVPDVKLDWKDVIIGACFTSFLFTAGKQLIGLYLGHESYSSTYGAAGSILIILVWVYYSAQLFFFGAEFTRVYAKNARQRSAAADSAARALSGDKTTGPISNDLSA